MLRIPFLLLVVAAAHAATPVFQASFDNPNRPGPWTAVPQCSIPASCARATNPFAWSRVAASQDTCVRLAPVNLTIGKRYELSGWVRTEDLAVRDLDRTPIAIGATLAMASMPFDVHSASLGGTRAMDPRLT